MGRRPALPPHPPGSSAGWTDADRTSPFLTPVGAVPRSLPELLRKSLWAPVCRQAGWAAPLPWEGSAATPGVLVVRPAGGAWAGGQMLGAGKGQDRATQMKRGRHSPRTRGGMPGRTFSGRPALMLAVGSLCPVFILSTITGRLFIPCRKEPRSVTSLHRAVASPSPATFLGCVCHTCPSPGTSAAWEPAGHRVPCVHPFAGFPQGSVPSTQASPSESRPHMHYECLRKPVGEGCAGPR